MIKDIYGHRGARGLYAENTIEGFEKAIKMPIKGIELDVIISKDRQLVVSHEPWMSHLICKDLLGQPIRANREEGYNLFRMNYDEIQQYDCGSKLNPRFPFQQLFPAFKPLLKDVYELLGSKQDDSFTLLLELKSDPEWYGVFQPDPEEYAKLIMDFITQNPFKGKLIIQSFDPKLLNAIHEISDFPNLGLLVDNKNNVDKNLLALEFEPSHYNVYHAFVTEELFASLEAKQIEPNKEPFFIAELNSVPEANRLRDIGITGIITDYPDLFLKPQS